MTLSTVKKIAAGACIAVSAFFCGCEPYDAENLFPLPGYIWDKAEKQKTIQAYEIKNVAPQEFINLKALLQSSGFKQDDRDFYFAPRTKENKRLKVPSYQGEILIKRSHLVEQNFPAAVYMTKDKRLLIGFGLPEF